MYLGKVDIVAMLLEHNRDEAARCVNLKARWHCERTTGDNVVDPSDDAYVESTPAYLAAKFGRSGALRALLAADLGGAVVDVRACGSDLTRQGERRQLPPMCIAIVNSRPACARELIDAERVDVRGVPLDFLVNVLALRPPSNDFVFDFVWVRRTLKRWYDAGLSVVEQHQSATATHTHGTLMLFKAARMCQANVAYALLTLPPSQVDVGARNDAGNTPLDVALLARHPRTLLCLAGLPSARRATSARLQCIVEARRRAMLAHGSLFVLCYESLVYANHEAIATLPEATTRFALEKHRAFHRANGPAEECIRQAMRKKKIN
jgi:hypothetical protein